MSVRSPFHPLARPSLPTHKLHPEQKVVLVFDQELEHRLTQRVLGRSHLVFRVRNDSRLEDDREVCYSKHYASAIRFRRKDDRRNENLLGAVIKLTSDFLANTLKRSST